MASPILPADPSTWQTAWPGRLPAADEIHVWLACVEVTPAQREIMAGILSRDEAERARRFHFDRDRNRFIAARGMLRHILGRYLDEDPGKLRFDYSAFGKPSLSRHCAPALLSFNLSHAGTLALFGVGRQRRIGVDIERVRGDLEFEEIAGRFFSIDEMSSLEQTPPERQGDVFFRYWTRKEALLKGMGQGLSSTVQDISISSMRDGEVSPIPLPGENKGNAVWHGQDLYPCPGYAGAIAVEGGGWAISCWQHAAELTL